MKTITTQIMIVTDGGGPFDGDGTTIGLTDAGGGAFVTLSQSDTGNLPPGVHIGIDAKEWPAIREGIEKMLAIAEGINTGTPVCEGER